MMSNLPILYSFRRCPYAMRARMALIYADIKYEHREILLKKKPPCMLAMSPKGTVPVLLHDKKVLAESIDIMLWALGKNDPDGWNIGDDMSLIDRNDLVFKPLLDRYKYPVRFPNEDLSNIKDQSFSIIMDLNNGLKDHSYLCGDKTSLADIAIFPFIRQYAHTDKRWFDAQNIPFLQKWLDNYLESNLFIRAMEKHPLFVF